MIRLRLGPLSLGRAGPRLTAGPRWFRASVGASGARLYASSPHLYGIFNPGRKQR